GKATWANGECVDVASVPGTFVVAGSVTLTSAPGDELVVSYSVTTPPPDASGSIHPRGTYTITGGTGRFDGATGRGFVVDEGNVVPGTVQTAIFVGTIRA